MATEKMKWVYKGQTETTSGTLAYWIGMLGPEMGLVVRDAVYPLKKKRRFVVGQVYESDFDLESKQAINMHSAKMCVGERWNQREVFEWEAEQEAAMARHRLKKLEKEDARVSEIERVLKPLRDSYAAMAKRGDWSGCNALEIAVLRNLKHALRSYE